MLNAMPLAILALGNLWITLIALGAVALIGMAIYAFMEDALRRLLGGAGLDRSEAAGHRPAPLLS